jgi:hypothetical protein
VRSGSLNRIRIWDHQQDSCWMPARAGLVLWIEQNPDPEIPAPGRTVQKPTRTVQDPRSPRSAVRKGV